ncbi:MAG: hypothetical protein H7339_19235 [Arcicella sp.]|nr:hypothetical protein [Arcicella sp.]
MKSYLILLFVLFITKSYAQNVTSSEEQDEIKKVIADESKFFYVSNIEKWATCYRQTPQTYWARIEKEGVFQKEGWDNIMPFVTNYFKENPKVIKATFKRENYNFRKVNPTYIWVTFDQNRTVSEIKSSSKETRILELIKGEWKIINATGFYVPDDKSVKSEIKIITKDKNKSESSEKEASGKEKKSKIKDTKKTS